MGAISSISGGTIKHTSEGLHHPGKPLPPQIEAPPDPPGLGDVVERFAKPVAHLIDAASERFLPEGWQTAISSCAACARRQNKLNLLCPNILTCPGLGKLLGALPKSARAALMGALEKRAKES